MPFKFLRKYGTATTINFALYTPDGALLKKDAVHASGDIVLSKDEGAEATYGTGFVDEGKTYSLALDASSLTCKRAMFTIEDQTDPAAWMPIDIIVETYGHANAQIVADLDLDIQIIKALVGFPNAEIVLDTNGTADSSFPLGSTQNPCLSMSDLSTAVSNTGFKNVRVVAGSSFTATTALQNLVLVGENYAVNLGTSINLEGLVLHGAEITAAVTPTYTTNEPKFIDCVLSAAQDLIGRYAFCGFVNATYDMPDDSVEIYQGRDLAPFTGQVTFNFTGSTGSAKLDLHFWAGGCVIANSTNAGNGVVIGGSGRVTTASTSTSGSLLVLPGTRPDYTLGSMTVTDLSNALRSQAESISSAQVNTDAAIAIIDSNVDSLITSVATVDSNVDAIKVNTDKLPEGFNKNTAGRYHFVGLDSTNHQPTTGKTWSGQRQLDNGTWESVGGTFTEPTTANGGYYFDYAAADVNADTGLWRFSATGADDVWVSFKTF